MIERVMIAGGGTGGHLFPGIAVVEELRRRIPDVEIVFVGTERGIEARILPALGETLELVEVTPLKGRSPLELAKSVGRLPGAMARAMSLVRRHRPSVVLGVGGYASGPVLAAAAALGVPTAVLEQNARVGMTNRLLAPVVGRAYVSFAETATTFLASRVRVAGNPVRRAFVDAARRAAADPAGFEARARRVLVLGGSQGARALNAIVPAALAQAGVRGRGISVLHQAGAAMQDEVSEAYRALGVDAEVVTFIDDMALAYASATLVVARAGATTVAELSAVGRPSILVPYPFAADDHQFDNALALERAGAAKCIRESELDVGSLASEVAALLDSESRRTAMAEAARRLGRPDAAASVVDDLCAWLGCENAEDADARGASGGASGSEPPSGGPMRRSSAPGRVPYVPGTITTRRSSSPPSPRPALVVGWEA